MKIGYIRISNKDNTPMWQLGALAAAGCDSVVEEKSLHVSKKRPELDKLINEMQSGDTLVVWGFERLACSIADLREIIQRLHNRGIILQSIKEKFNSTDEQVSLKLKMLDDIVTLKTHIDNERSVAQQKSMKDKGIVRVRQRKLSDRDMQLVFALIDEGIPKKHIAKKFDISSTNLNKWLRDPRYMGEVILRPRRNPALKQRLREGRDVINNAGDLDPSIDELNNK